MLITAGHYSHAEGPTGYFGAYTKQCLEAWQTAAGLPVTGVTGASLSAAHTAPVVSSLSVSFDATRCLLMPFGAFWHPLHVATWGSSVHSSVLPRTRMNCPRVPRVPIRMCSTRVACMRLNTLPPRRVIRPVGRLSCMRIHKQPTLGMRNHPHLEYENIPCPPSSGQRLLYAGLVQADYRLQGYAHCSAGGSHAAKRHRATAPL